MTPPSSNSSSGSSHDGASAALEFIDTPGFEQNVEVQQVVAKVTEKLQNSNVAPDCVLLIVSLDQPLPFPDDGVLYSSLVNSIRTMKGKWKGLEVVLIGTFVDKTPGGSNSDVLRMLKDLTVDCVFPLANYTHLGDTARNLDTDWNLIMALKQAVTFATGFNEKEKMIFQDLS